MLHGFIVREHQSAEKRKLIPSQPGDQTGKRGIQGTDARGDAELVGGETSDYFLRLAPIYFHNVGSMRPFRTEVNPIPGANLHVPSAGVHWNLG